MFCPETQFRVKTLFWLTALQPNDNDYRGEGGGGQKGQGNREVQASCFLYLVCPLLPLFLSFLPYLIVK